jgi:hypothetical protein
MTGPVFPFDLEDFASTLTRVCAQRGRSMEVALLMLGTFEVEGTAHEDFGQEFLVWTLTLRVDAQLFGRLEHEDIEPLERSLQKSAEELLKGKSDHRLVALNISPRVDSAPGWRDEAAKWLRLQGVTNQGRVRSTNVPPYSEDGLLFRSHPEMHLYRALKASGLTFAPLPVFLRGGRTYSRIEPDFVVVADGLTLVIEVDGDHVHTESPADAEKRLGILTDHGPTVLRVKASECDDEVKAKQFVVARLLPHLERLRRIK